MFRIWRLIGRSVHFLGPAISAAARGMQAKCSVRLAPSGIRDRNPRVSQYAKEIDAGGRGERFGGAKRNVLLTAERPLRKAAAINALELVNRFSSKPFQR